MSTHIEKGTSLFLEGTWFQLQNSCLRTEGGSLTSCEDYCSGQVRTDVFMYSVIGLFLGVSLEQTLHSHKSANKNSCRDITLKSEIM